MLATTPLPETVLDAAEAIAVPRQAPADSFVLHAPLELMARVGLLPYLDADTRAEAIEQLARLADRYTSTGPGVATPRARQFDDMVAAVAALTGAITASDLDAVDATMVWITTHATAPQLRPLLGELVVDSLGAAAHTPIGLSLLPIVAGGQLPPALLRAPVRELARHPDWKVRWFRDTGGPHAGAPGPGDDLGAALRAVPHLGRPGSDFIFPLMSQAENSRAAPRLLAPALATDTRRAGRMLMRAAAWSMLHDDPAQAPYGWSHCLTMPQAVMGLAGDAVTPRTALAVAGTYVVGFRAAHGLEPLGRLDDGAGRAHTGNGDASGLAAYAAVHHDAHLVKYTLAGFLAADNDPAWAGTYFAAAQFLADWWRTPRAG